MKKGIKLCCLFTLLGKLLLAQEISLDKKVSLEPVYLKTVEAERLLPMNELDMEFGYVLYEAEITKAAESEELLLENVRDYAVVYVDGKLQGTLTDRNKKIAINGKPGRYLLQLYVENIGRITYGPEILDNAKGIFGDITLDGNDIESWKMTPLNIKNFDVDKLNFGQNEHTPTPGFYKGTFNVDAVKNTYLDISGWGMGEVWVNNKYVGAYWEEEKQKSILIPSENLSQGTNELLVFELKNNQQKTMKLSQTPVFK